MVHEREKLPASLGLQRMTRLAGWFNDPKNEDPLHALQQRFTEFTENLSRCEQAAARHIYNNPDFTPLDARQHRFMLCALLTTAEELAIDFLILERPEETSVYVTFLDEQIKRLHKVFQEWHGDSEPPAEFTADDLGDAADAALSNAMSFSAARSVANQPAA